MIWIAQHDPALIAIVYYPNGNTELIQGYNSPDRLVVVTVTADQPLNIDQLLAPALNRPEYCLVLGVISSGVSEQNIAILRKRLDALFMVPDEAIERVAHNLAIAVSTPGEPSQAFCTDWSDMCSLILGISPDAKCMGPTRAGSARAEGPSAAKEAAIAALEKIGSIEDCRVLCMLTGPKGLKGAQVKEVFTKIRTQTGNGYCMPCYHIDSSIPEGTLQVDIFVFGLAARISSEPRSFPPSRL